MRRMIGLYLALGVLGILSRGQAAVADHQDRLSLFRNSYRVYELSRNRYGVYRNSLMLNEAPGNP